MKIIAKLEICNKIIQLPVSAVALCIIAQKGDDYLFYEYEESGVNYTKERLIRMYLTEDKVKHELIEMEIKFLLSGYIGTIIANYESAMRNGHERHYYLYKKG